MVWVNDVFQTEFYGLDLPATEEIELAVRKLEEASLDAPILDELGDKAEISASQFRAFLAANRESSEWFIFYLNGRNGKRAVDAYWYVGLGGWVVNANSVTNPNRWNQGNQVVSKLSSFKNPLYGVFVFFCQPPSIRPISSRCLEERKP